MNTGPRLPADASSSGAGPASRMDVERCYTREVVNADEYYDGVPVAELAIIEVDVPDPVHLQRSLRYPGAVDIDPVAAIEAAGDAAGLIARDPNSATGEAIRVIGYSPTAARVLVVVLIPDEHPPSGLWHVVTAWPASRPQRRSYTSRDDAEVGDHDEPGR